MKKKREILITNDDGVNAKGIGVLVEMMREFGNITVIAPENAMSGMSTAISLGKKISLRTIKEEEGVRIYAMNGTPADCVKMAMNIIFTDTKPDLLVSGINHGSNASVASHYSGTLGAAIEGTIYGIPSIGFSLDSHKPDADFSPVVKYGKIVIEKYLHHPAEKMVYLNVNFPAIPTEKVKGIRMAHRGAGRWIKEFTIVSDGNGGHYHWMEGTFEDLEESDKSTFGDHKLLQEGYVSVVPHYIDNTVYSEIDRLAKAWDL